MGLLKKLVTWVVRFYAQLTAVPVPSRPDDQIKKSLLKYDNKRDIARFWRF